MTDGSSEKLPATLLTAYLVGERKQIEQGLSYEENYIRSVSRIYVYKYMHRFTRPQL